MADSLAASLLVAMQQLHVLLLENNRCSDFSQLEFDLGRTRVMTEINIGRNG